MTLKIFETIPASLYLSPWWETRANPTDLWICAGLNWTKFYANYASLYWGQQGPILEELFDLLRMPSVSADPAFAGDVRKTADAVADQLRKAGADNVEVIETAGHPIVFGEKIVAADKPTVMVYGHYDVQPPDPLDLWDSGPFEPVVKKTAAHPDGAIYARGSCDDKDRKSVV